MKKILSLFLATAFLISPAVAQEKTMKRTPLSQEELQERSIEAEYGVEVERDRIERSANDRSTFDRYGDGAFGTFQSSSDARGLEDDDSIGVNLRILEFE